MRQRGTEPPPPPRPLPGPGAAPAMPHKQPPAFPSALPRPSLLTYLHLDLGLLLLQEAAQGVVFCRPARLLPLGGNLYDPLLNGALQKNEERRAVAICDIPSRLLGLVSPCATHKKGARQAKCRCQGGRAERSGAATGCRQAGSLEAWPPKPCIAMSLWRRHAHHECSTAQRSSIAQQHRTREGTPCQSAGAPPSQRAA